MSENYLGIITEKYYRELWQLHGPSYITSHGKVEIYRDTGVSKNMSENYEWKLWVKIMSENYPWKLWPSISMTQKSWDL